MEKLLLELQFKYTLSEKRHFKVLPNVFKVYIYSLELFSMFRIIGYNFARGNCSWTQSTGENFAAGTRLSGTTSPMQKLPREQFF